MPEKTCPPHEWKITDYRYYSQAYCFKCELEIEEKEIERRLNEHERLAIGIDAFLSGATLLLMFSHASEAWSNFIIRWVKRLQGLKEE